MDPGIDDAIMLLLALGNPALELLGISTVRGNVSLHKATVNALRIIEASRKKIAVYKGASGSLRKDWRPERAESVHGRDGLGESNLPRPKLLPEKISAVDTIVEMLKTRKKKEISIVATAPLTNIATLCEREPSLVKNLDGIFVMGGTYDPLCRGNMTEFAEFNFYSDPEAADIVMSSMPTIVASGLDVTTDPACAITGKTVSTICSQDSKSAELACKILGYPLRTHPYFNLHDVFALFSFLYPEIFKLERCRVRVDCSRNFRGRCIVRSNSRGNVLVCRRVDQARFNALLLDGLA